jgi:hypothetical protein
MFTVAKLAGYLGEVEKRIARVLALRSDGLLAWTRSLVSSLTSAPCGDAGRARQVR